MIPLKDWVLIKPQDAKTKSEQGIILKGEEDKKTEVAKVLKLGHHIGEDSLIKEGDMIIFKSYNVEEVVIDEEVYHFIENESIISIV